MFSLSSPLRLPLHASSSTTMTTLSLSSASHSIPRRQNANLSFHSTWSLPRDFEKESVTRIKTFSWLSRRQLSWWPRCLPFAWSSRKKVVESAGWSPFWCSLLLLLFVVPKKKEREEKKEFYQCIHKLLKRSLSTL